MSDWRSVNNVFDEFKREFFPGEEVIVLLNENDVFEGVIREKAKFPEIKGFDGTIQREAFSRYFVRIKGKDSEILSDDATIRRDKKLFTSERVKENITGHDERDEVD